MKQIFTFIALAAILWIGFSYLNQQIGAPQVRDLTVGPDLTIDGHQVIESFSFTNPTVVDGDSVRVADSSGNEIDLRLAALDAPELNQSFGREAKRQLQAMLKNQNAVAWNIGTDRYDRKVVFLFIQQPDGSLFEINAKMIQDGYAWHYKQHSSNPLLDNFEYEARVARIGLWSDPVQPVPPWEFRQQ